MKFRAYIADTFEVLQNGKVLALGLFPDHVLVVHTQAGEPAPSDAAPIGIEASLMMSFSEVDEPTVTGHAVVIPPDSDRPVARTNFEARRQSPGSATNVITKFKPLPVRAPGIFKLQVHVNGHDFEDWFEVRVTPPPGAAAAQPPAKAARKRTARKG